jgi:hypothetical protein
MMKTTLRQVGVVLTTLLTLVVNGLANALPINGLQTGEISDRFEVYFVPAGYVFSIWGLIYVGLIAYSLYQALPTQKDNPRLRATGWWVAGGNLANSAWILLWHYERFLWTVPVMLALLGSLIVAYLRLREGSASVTPPERWAAWAPISVYLGWITVATIANVTATLDYLGWSRWGLSDEAWMVILVGAVALIGAMMSFTRRDLGYAAVLLWALAGIGIKFPSAGIVTTAVWGAFGTIAATLALAYLWSGKHPIRSLSW